MSYSTTHQPLFDMDIIGGSGEQRQPMHSQCRRTGCICTYVKCYTIAVLGTLLLVCIAGTGDLVWALFLVPMREVGKGHVQCTCMWHVLRQYPTPYRMLCMLLPGLDSTVYRPLHIILSPPLPPLPLPLFLLF